MTATTPRPILDAEALAAMRRRAEAAGPHRWALRGKDVDVVNERGPVYVVARTPHPDYAAHIDGMDPPTTLALLDQLEETERLRTEALHEHADMMCQRMAADERCASAETELAQARAEIKELREALMPFAEFYRDIIRNCYSVVEFQEQLVELWPEHFRRAARLLATQDQDGEAGR